MYGGFNNYAGGFYGTHVMFQGTKLGGEKWYALNGAGSVHNPQFTFYVDESDKSKFQQLKTEVDAAKSDESKKIGLSDVTAVIVGLADPENAKQMNAVQAAIISSTTSDEVEAKQYYITEVQIHGTLVTVTLAPTYKGIPISGTLLRAQAGGSETPKFDYAIKLTGDKNRLTEVLSKSLDVAIEATK